MLMKKPFQLGSLNPVAHPIAFLLILCDELQEWNREAYGIKDKLRTLAAAADVEINDNKLSVTFVSHNGLLPSDFSREKKKLLYNLCDLGALFGAVSIRCKASKKQVLPKPDDEISARPALEDLEKLAKAIHELYNENQLKRHPDKPLKYADFDTLTDSLKYSNLRQAMNIPEKLHQMGFVMRPAGSEGQIINEIPEEYTEYLAEEEHESWVNERIASGWISSDAVDAEKKTTPYLVPYDQLPEDIKQLDRDPVQNIPLLLERIGMAVYKK